MRGKGITYSKVNKAWVGRIRLDGKAVYVQHRVLSELVREMNEQMASLGFCSCRRITLTPEEVVLLHERHRLPIDVPFA
ncbi:MAG: hypothetical protein IT381_05980 [Deltaproteobacteria bacterium]|nr:hypothetical protein [Deltaproteobacteria bacterium]